MSERQTLQRQFPQWLWVVPILLLSFALSVPNFTRDAFWLDEVLTQRFTGTGLAEPKSLGEAFTTFAYDRTPPLYYVMTMIWSKIVGSTPFTDFSLSALVALVAIAAMYRVGKLLFDKQSGIIASLMLATSAFFIHYSHEHRTYTLFVFVIAMLIWFYWKIITRRNYRKTWLKWGFVFSIALSLYTHFVASAFVIAIGAYHILFARASRKIHLRVFKKRWQEIFRLWVYGCLLFLPWFLVLLLVLFSEATNDRASSYESILSSSIYGFTNNLGLIFIPLTLASLVYLKELPVRFLWFSLITSLFVVLVINQATSFLFHPRHIIVYLIIIILLSIPALKKLDEIFVGFSKILIGIFAGMGIIYSITPNFMNQIVNHVPAIPQASIIEIREVAQSCIGINDAVVFSTSTPNFETVRRRTLEYYVGDSVSYIAQLHTLLNLEIDQSVSTSDDFMTLDDLIAGRDLIWIISLPELSNTSDIMAFDNRLHEQGYNRCPLLSLDSQTDIWAYSQDAEACQSIVTVCQQ